MRERAVDTSERDAATSALVREFVSLNRRRLHGDPPLEMAELSRWEELREQLEDVLGAVPPRATARRRRALRVRARLKVLVTTQLAQELLVVHDVSEHGVFLRTQRPVAAGSSLQVELRDRHGRTLELEGSVVWVRTEAEGLGPPGMGVAFHALSDWDRAVLSELVEGVLAGL